MAYGPEWLSPQEIMEIELNDEYNARFDDVRERYHSEIEDIRMMDICDDFHRHREEANSLPSFEERHEELHWLEIFEAVWMGEQGKGVAR